MADNIIFHVAAADDGWTITREGRRSLVARASGREQAIERARRELLKHPNGILRIHGDDYVVVEEVTAEQLAGAAPHGNGGLGT